VSKRKVKPYKKMTAKEWQSIKALFEAKVPEKMMKAITKRTWLVYHTVGLSSSFADYTKKIGEYMDKYSKHDTKPMETKQTNGTTPKPDMNDTQRLILVMTEVAVQLKRMADAWEYHPNVKKSSFFERINLLQPKIS